MSNNSIWMPLYIGDYLADTQLLTTEQHGAYFLLIMAYWKNEGPLPDNDEVLSALCKLTPSKWKKVKAVLMQYFDAVDGKLVHGRIEKEFAEQADRKKKAEIAAKKRWEKEQAEKGAKAEKSESKSDARDDAQDNARDDARTMLEGCKTPCSDDANHNQSHSQGINPMPVPEVNWGCDLVDFTTGEVIRRGAGQ